MPTPDFIVELRQKIGHDLLFLAGVRGLVTNPDGQVLLTLRADTKKWALPAGILEPADADGVVEQPEQALAREVLEECNVAIYGTMLLETTVGIPRAYPNGDKVQFIHLTFSARTHALTASVGDEENLEVRFFAPTDLPQQIHPDTVRLINEYL